MCFAQANLNFIGLLRRQRTPLNSNLKSWGQVELYVPFCNVQYPHKEVLESELEAFLRKNGIETAGAEADGISDEKTYGPLPEDIKKLLRENGLDASECGDTLGELFQRWGIE